MNIAQNIPFFNTLPPETQSLILNGLLLFVVLLVIWVLRNLVARIIMVPMRGVAKRTRTPIDDRALDVIERPLRVLVLGVGISVVMALFDFNPMLDRFAESLSRALILAAIMFFIYNLIDVIGVTTQSLRTLTGISLEERLLPFLRVVIKVFIVVMGGLIIIQEFGYDVTGLIASFGVIGLAFSLAAQDTASNVFGFTAIVGDNPFQIGDYIISGDVAGVVEQVGVRSTRIRKLDQSLVVMPNNKLSGSPITNWTRLTKRRMDFMIGVAYRTNATQMRTLLERLREMLRSRSDIDPESVVVHFVSFGDSALQIRVIAFILLPDWAQFTAEVEQINLAIMDIVQDVGTEFAFPSHSIYIESMDNPVPVQPVKQQQKKYDTQSYPAVASGNTEESFQDNATISSNEDGDHK